MKLKLSPEGQVIVRNGKPVYDAPDGKEVEFDVEATVSTISRLNAEAKAHREGKEAAEGRLKLFEGIEDPVKARKAMDVVANLDGRKLIEAGEKDKAIAEAIKAVEEKYAPITKRAETLESQLNAHLVGGAFSRSKFIAEKFAAQGPAGVEIAQALFGNRLKVEDGKVVAYDAQGSKIFSRARPGETADADEAIELLVDSYAHKDSLLKSSGASGGGAAPSKGAGGGKTATRAQFDGMDQNARMAFSKAGGQVTD